MKKTDFILIKAHLKGFYRYMFTGYDNKGNGLYLLVFEKRDFDLNLKLGQLVNQSILMSFDIKNYCDTKRPSEAWCLSETEMPKELIVEYND